MNDVAAAVDHVRQDYVGLKVQPSVLDPGVKADELDMLVYGIEKGLRACQLTEALLCQAYHQWPIGHNPPAWLRNATGHAVSANATSLMRRYPWPLDDHAFRYFTRRDGCPTCGGAGADGGPS